MKSATSILRLRRNSARVGALVGFTALEAAVTATANPLLRSDAEYTRNFLADHCAFASRGETTYFVLEPGYQLVFEGEDEGESVRVVQTVLDRTETLELPGVGPVEVRAVEDREWVDGEMAETSIAYLAICEQTGDVYEFGGDAYIHDADGGRKLESSWRAGRPDADGLAEPGIYVPGTFLVGARYFQEMAEGLAMERAENVEAGLTVTTRAGVYENCVKVFESSALEEAAAAGYKVHAPGVGVLRDGPLELVKLGYRIVKFDDAPAAGAQAEPTRKISDEQAREIALQAVPGEVMDIGVERKLGAKRIVVEIIAKADMAETDVIIDMETGEVLAIEK